MIINEKEVLNTERFKDLSWAKVAKDYIIQLGGLGGIGSWTALLLSRAGFNIHAFDFDNVDDTNLGGQLYSSNTVNLSKSEAITMILNELAPGHNLIAHNVKLQFDKIEDSAIISPFVVTGFDNMAARKGMFEQWFEKFNTNKKGFFIDGRMRAEGFQLYYVSSIEDAERYAKTLFSDKDVPDEICSIKATSHVGAMIGSLITALVANHFSDADNDPRSNPYYTTVDLELFNFEVK